MDRNENRAKGWTIAVGFSIAFYVVTFGSAFALLHFGLGWL